MPSSRLGDVNLLVRSKTCYAKMRLPQRLATKNQGAIGEVGGGGGGRGARGCCSAASDKHKCTTNINLVNVDMSLSS